MGYVNTGTKRSLIFTLTKKENGSPMVGYPKTYNGQLGSWSASYDAITDTELARLSDVDYNARVVAFLAYVESVESGFSSSTDFINSNEVVDHASCPVPTTTTTTVAPTTTTTTT
jgi:hypothetical protein